MAGILIQMQLAISVACPNFLFNAFLMGKIGIVIALIWMIGAAISGSADISAANSAPQQAAAASMAIFHLIIPYMLFRVIAYEQQCGMLRQILGRIMPSNGLEEKSGKEVKMRPGSAPWDTSLLGILVGVAVVIAIIVAIVNFH